MAFTVNSGQLLAVAVHNWVNSDGSLLDGTVFIPSNSSPPNSPPLSATFPGLFTVSDTVVNSAGNVNVWGGGTAISSILNGGFQDVLAGGIANGTKVSAGGEEFLDGGTASGAIIFDRSAEGVGVGGTATSATVSSGGFQTLNFGTAFGTIVLNGGELLNQEGIASGTTIERWPRSGSRRHCE